MWQWAIYWAIVGAILCVAVLTLINSLKLNAQARREMSDLNSKLARLRR